MSLLFDNSSVAVKTPDSEIFKIEVLTVRDLATVKMYVRNIVSKSLHVFWLLYAYILKDFDINR